MEQNLIGHYVHFVVLTIGPINSRTLNYNTYPEGRRTVRTEQQCVLNRNARAANIQRV